MNRGSKSVVIWIALLVTTSASSVEVTTDPQKSFVGSDDFFLYSCLREYMAMNSIQIFDNSGALVVEYSNLSSEALNQIYQSAKTYAETIPSPNFTDSEHGLQAVIFLCQRESVKLKGSSE
jgi:hypothetical protein